MALKIALYPFGSRGDVQPFIPLALALQERGHAVRIFATGVATAAWLQSAGLSVRLAEGVPDVDELIKSSPTLMQAMRTGNFQAFSKGRFELMQSFGAALVAGLAGFAEEFKADVALVHAVLNPFGCYMRELGTPVVKLYLQPAVPTPGPDDVDLRATVGSISPSTPLPPLGASASGSTTETRDMD